MANTNVNIANKLYAYIKHGCDINESIKEIYNNSMIFIGDEKQIYVPVMNTYVGIGMTAYNATIDRIASVENQMKELADTLSSDLVSKIYANYSPEDISYITTESLSSTFENSDWVSSHWALNNEITIRGINDYDPSTGLSRRNVQDHRYTFKGEGELTAHEVDKNADDPNNLQPYSTLSQATSGITVTPHWGEERRITNSITGQTITKRFGNYLEIDDKLTWSYMTSAYSYTMNFAQKYTASEVDRLYHNLLGDAVSTYLPVSFGSAIDNQTGVFTDLVAQEGNTALENYNTSHSGVSYVVALEDAGNPTKYYVIDLTKQYYYCYLTDGDSKNYVLLSSSDLQTLVSGGELSLPAGVVPVKYTEGSDITDFPQLYILDTQYNSTYNMNIAEGIETLKEVAYLLDLLSDGQLGSVTYYTYGQVTDPENYPSDYATNSVNQNYENHWISTDTSWKPKAGDTYAYLVKIGDPENLGIQIAYSIAGNKTQIDDLHQHSYLLETGQTTLRSIQSTSSEFATLSLIGGTTHWVDTDSNQGESNFNNDAINHPNKDAETGARLENSYLVGDVNLKINLLTASTYATVNPGAATNNPHFVGEDGVEWWGCYTLADMDSVTDNGTSYFTMDAGCDPTTDNCTFTEVGNVVTDGRQSVPQYYWRPNFTETNYSVNQNNTFSRIKVSDLIAKSNDEYIYDKDGIQITKGDATFYSQKDVTTIIGTAGQVSAALGTTVQADDYVYFISSTETTVIHASYTSNGLTTVDWVGAYVDARVSGIADDLENILDEAKQYTDEQIDKLDSEHIYSDFATYFATYCSTHSSEEGKADLAVVGSALYNTTYADEYATFVTRGQNGETGLYGDNDSNNLPGTANNPYRLSYIANSYVLTNVKEVNGIVTAEGRELPTDTISSDVKVWGSENNFAGEKHEYSVIDGLTSSTNLLQALYAWSKQVAGAETTDDTSDDVWDNQIFVRIADAEYEPIPTSETLNSISGVYFKLDQETLAVGGAGAKVGDYCAFVPTEFSTAGLESLDVADYANTNDRRWRQLYRKTDKYLELNLQDAEEVYNGGNLNESQITIGDFILTLENGSITVSGTGVNSTYNKLYYISTRATDSTEYLSVEHKHFDFKDNGTGENSFKVTAHITKLEDATPTNTGLADAFDVKSYIDNLFRWVDISATISQSTIVANDVYHKNVSIDEWDAVETLWKRTETLSGNTVTGVSFESESSPKYAWYWKDDNAYFAGATDSDSNPEGNIIENNVEPTGNQVNRGAHIEVDGHYLYKQFNSSNDHTKYDRTHNYYIEIEHATVNPLNFTETEFGDNRE